jgi:hypothetical protein
LLKTWAVRMLGCFASSLVTESDRHVLICFSVLTDDLAGTFFADVECLYVKRNMIVGVPYLDIEDKNMGYTF